MLKIAGTYRVWMQLDASQVDDPGEARGIVDYDFFSSPARGEGQRDGSQPGWTLGRGSFLVEGFALGAIHEAFQNDGPILNSSESARRNGQVIPHDVEFRKRDLFREIQLIGMGNTDLVPVDQQYLGTFFLFHATRLHLTVHQKLFTYGPGNREAQAGIALFYSLAAPPWGDESIVPLFHECKLI